MGDVVRLSDQGKCYREAGDWIARFDCGLTKAEEAEFQEWVCRNQQNHDVFMSMAQLWHGMSDLSRLSELFPAEPEKIITSGYANTGKRMAIAASFVLVVFTAGLFGRLPLFYKDIEKIYETSIGEHSTVSLPDGSQLILNTNSLVKVGYDEYHRLVVLERGEIYIDVAHDESRPLSIMAGDNVVQAVGTAFNVELHDGGQLELIVTDGKVRVGDRVVFERRLLDRARRNGSKTDDFSIVRLPVEALAISQDEKIVLGGLDQASTKLEAREIETSLSWQQGNLIFNGQPLGEAVKEIGRYTSMRFEFADDDLKKVRVGGVFKTGDVTGLLIALDDTFNISSKQIDEKHIRLYGVP